MHVALIPDAQRLVRERSWFNRTVVGLLAAGIRITRLLPSGQPEDQRLSLTAVHWYNPGRIQRLTRSAGRDLASRLPAPPPDLIHAMGRGAWDAAIDLGKRIERPVVLDVWSVAEARAAGHYGSQSIVSGFLASSDAIAAVLGQRVDAALVRTVPIGVFVPPKPQRIFESAEGYAAAVVAGHEASASSVKSLIDGFARVAAENPNLMLFADLNDRVADPIWKHAESLNVLGQLSLIPWIEAHRELVLQADMLLVPDTRHATGSLLLEAMASPMATIAVRDQCIDLITDPQCAVLLDDAESASAWTEAIRQLVDDPTGAREMAARARQRVMDDHPMSRQIDRLTQTYEQVITGGAMRFNAPEA